MTDISLDQYYDAVVYDSDDEKVGGVGQVFLDETTGQPSWVTVRTGLFGLKENFVPLVDARLEDGKLHVAFTKDFIKDAPKLDPEAPMTVAEEDALQAYYGTEDEPEKIPGYKPAAPSGEAPDTSVPAPGEQHATEGQGLDADRDLDRDHDRDGDLLRDGDRDLDADRDQRNAGGAALAGAGVAGAGAAATGLRGDNDDEPRRRQPEPEHHRPEDAPAAPQDAPVDQDLRRDDRVDTREDHDLSRDNDSVRNNDSVRDGDSVRDHDRHGFGDHRDHDRQADDRRDDVNHDIVDDNPDTAKPVLVTDREAAHLDEEPEEGVITVVDGDLSHSEGAGRDRDRDLADQPGHAGGQADDDADTQSELYSRNAPDTSDQLDPADDLSADKEHVDTRGDMGLRQDSTDREGVNTREDLDVLPGQSNAEAEADESPVDVHRRNTEAAANGEDIEHVEWREDEKHVYGHQTDFADETERDLLDGDQTRAHDQRGTDHGTTDHRGQDQLRGQDYDGDQPRRPE